MVRDDFLYNGHFGNSNCHVSHNLDSLKGLFRGILGVQTIAHVALEVLGLGFRDPKVRNETLEIEGLGFFEA